MPLSKILTALADETCRNILGLSPQALSYHLAKLKKAGLIYETRHKNFIYYELDLTILDEAILWIDNLKKGES